jgi:hypothetical protein
MKEGEVTTRLTQVIRFLTTMNGAFHVEQTEGGSNVALPALVPYRELLEHLAVHAADPGQRRLRIGRRVCA